MDTPRPQLLDFQFHQNNDSFTLRFQDRLILIHSKDNPCLWIGSGIADIDMFRGNFSIKDKLQEKIALTDAIVSQSPDGWLIHFSRGSDISATLNISADDHGRLLLELQNDNLNHNRIWLRLAAQPEDHIYGCGDNSPTLICAANRSRYGPVNKALVATNKPMSPGRPTAKRMREGITTGPSFHNPRLLARRSITAMLITVAI